MLRTTIMNIYWSYYLCYNDTCYYRHYCSQSPGPAKKKKKNIFTEPGLRRFLMLSGHFFLGVPEKTPTSTEKINPQTIETKRSPNRKKKSPNHRKKSRGWECQRRGPAVRMSQRTFFGCPTVDVWFLDFCLLVFLPVSCADGRADSWWKFSSEIWCFVGWGFKQCEWEQGGPRDVVELVMRCSKAVVHG